MFLKFVLVTFFEQVIIVDDGSTDGTQRIAFDFVRKYTIDVVRVFPLGKNCGKGEAIRNVSNFHIKFS